MVRRVKKISKKYEYVRDAAEIVVMFIAAWIFYQVLGIITGTNMPIVAVVSASMEPTLYRGDLLFVTSANYTVGDIVLYERNDVNYIIVHRIIKETEKGFVIKGDNNPSPDPGYVQTSQIKGKVRYAIPLLGYPRLALMIFGI